MGYFGKMTSYEHMQLTDLACLLFLPLKVGCFQHKFSNKRVRWPIYCISLWSSAL